MSDIDFRLRSRPYNRVNTKNEMSAAPDCSTPGLKGVLLEMDCYKDYTARPQEDRSSLVFDFLRAPFFRKYRKNRNY